MELHNDPIVIEALNFLARTREQLADFGRYLSWGRGEIAPIVINVVSDVNCLRYDIAFDFEKRRHESGLNLEAWIEAELENGYTLTWWVDVAALKTGWLVDAQVYWNVAIPGQDIFEDVVQRLPELVYPDFHTVQEKVPGIFEELFNTGKQALEKGYQASREHNG